MENRLVIVAYKPLPGKETELEKLVLKHHARLIAEGLVTSNRPFIGKAKDGTLLEIFEWLSPEAIQTAHSNPSVLAMWNEFATACEYIPTGQVPELQQLFSEFTVIGIPEKY